jgi:hypothetical protein
MIQGIIEQMIGGIIQMNPFARSTDESVRTLQAQMPQVVMRLVASAQGAVVEEFLLPGKAFLIGVNKADGSAWVRGYTAADTGLNIAVLLSAVMDHDGQR